MTGIEWVKFQNRTLVDAWWCQDYIQKLNKELQCYYDEQLKIEGEVSLYEMYYRALMLAGLDPKETESYVLCSDIINIDFKD